MWALVLAERRLWLALLLIPIEQCVQTIARLDITFSARAMLQRIHVANLRNRFQVRRRAAFYYQYPASLSPRRDRHVGICPSRPWRLRFARLLIGSNGRLFVT